VPNDPYFQSSGAWGQSYRDLWGLKSVNAKSAWDGTQGEDIVVAVVDSGLDLTHPDIAANVWSNPNEVVNGVDDDSNGHVDDLHGWDFIQNDAVPQDELGHGTHVAGTIAAVGNNSLGITGIAPRAQVMPVRVFDALGHTLTDGTLGAGLLYAALAGADVINNSWGCDTPCFSVPVFEEATRAAVALGAVVLFAAGNNGDDVFKYSPVNMTGPGARPVVVAASDRFRRPAQFDMGRATNYGATIDVSGPGGGQLTDFVNSMHRPDFAILSLRPATCTICNDTDLLVGDRYLRLGGTSMATPHAAGLAALLLACNDTPAFTLDDVRGVLQASGRKTQPDKYRIGFGQIDALAGVRFTSGARAQLRAPARMAQLTRGAGPVAVQGTAGGPNLTSWKLYAGQGSAPTQWQVIGSGTQPVDDDFLANWDLSPAQPGGVYTLKLLAKNKLPYVRSVAGECGTTRFPTRVRSRYTQDIQYVVVDDAIRLTTDDAVWYRSPTVASGYVASEARPATGPPVGPTLGIALSDITARVTTLVGTPGSTGPAFDPQNPDRFVYARSQGGIPEIYVHVVSTGADVPITAVGSAYRSAPAMDGQYVVWGDTRNGTADIYAYDLGSGTEQRLTNGSQVASAPRISGTTAVWQEGTQYPLPLGLHLHDLATNVPWVALATDPRAQAICPTISGNWVAWTTAAPLFVTNQVYAYNTSTMEVRQLSSPSTSDIHGCPAISGNLVAFINYTTTGAVVQTYDLTQSTGPTAITFNPMSLPNDVALSPEWVVWSDYLPGSLQLYFQPR